MELDLQQQFINRILCALIEYDVDLQTIKAKINLILADYKIEPKETALVVYTEGKNVILIRDFLLAKTVAGRTKRTIQMYGETLRRAFNDIGKDADAITPQDIQALFARTLMRGCSKCHCNNIYRVLRTFYTWAVLNKKLENNPTLMLDQIKYTKAKEEAFTALEIEKMRAVLKNNRERAIFELLLSTGCRASELVSIQIDDIHDDAVQVLGKGEKYRTVYINAKAKVAVDAYLSERKDMSPYLFPGGIASPLTKESNPSKCGDWYKYPELVDLEHPLGSGTINTTVKKIAKRADVEGAHTHRFRRTCATLALRRGMPIEQVSMMLGHEQISTTQIYLDIREEDLHESHKRYVTG